MDFNFALLLFLLVIPSAGIKFLYIVFYFLFYFL